MRPPAFWASGGHAPALLLPLAWLVAASTARRVARPGWNAPVPVICCGNAGVGGSGKTPLALDLAARLRARGRSPGFLTRGHGGKLRGPARVELVRHDAAATGDEAQLLAAAAPTWLGADRAASARLAVAAGCDVLVMDDGLQNPTLVKTMSLLAIDGGAGFGNGRVIPAGPLREPAAVALARCRAAVMIGADSAGSLPAGQVLHARIVPDAADVQALPSRLLAFAGIGRPGKFYDTLRDIGSNLLEMKDFPDHHRFRTRDLEELRARAAFLGAGLVTTQKDFARLPIPWRAGIVQLRIGLAWSQPAAIEALLDEALR